MTTIHYFQSHYCLTCREYVAGNSACYGNGHELREANRCTVHNSSKCGKR